MLYSEEIEKLNQLLDEYDKNFGNVDVNSLTKEEKKEFLKMKKKVDELRLQRDMMQSTLNTMKSFGVPDISIGRNEKNGRKKTK